MPRVLLVVVFVRVKKVMAGDSEQFMVTVPSDWKLTEYSTSKRKFPSVQDFIREIVRRDIEAYEKENKK
ncbi:hypothetical protein AUJ65_03885 [Candidatus Micrarchaeota archaeon CG1_02_51_15]|nr:MAG: hypothetical protein AUJ65_03885 [Candidatus Micrarchaeota archaeon CG1_02_51_15]